jgi:hypothetical protein
LSDEEFLARFGDAIDDRVAVIVGVPMSAVTSASAW